MNNRNWILIVVAIINTKKGYTIIISHHITLIGCNKNTQWKMRAHIHTPFTSYILNDGAFLRWIKSFIQLAFIHQNDAAICVKKVVIIIPWQRIQLILSAYRISCVLSKEFFVLFVRSLTHSRCVPFFHFFSFSIYRFPSPTYKIVRSLTHSVVDFAALLY